MIQVVAKDVAHAAANTAQWIASALRADIAERGRATLAISGGSTPAAMLRALSRESLPWAQLRIAQVDERIVPAGDARRNLAMLQTTLVDGGPLPSANMLAMPVDCPAAAAMDAYALLLGTLDIVQLGLGADGHTASLVPGDAVLQAQQPVALSALYQGTTRMTLTFSAINAARRIVWLVTGTSKRTALRGLLADKGGIPALQVRRTAVVVFADAAAAGAVAMA